MAIRLQRSELHPELLLKLYDEADSSLLAVLLTCQRYYHNASITLSMLTCSVGAYALYAVIR